MRSQVDKIHNLGAELVIVGNGQPNFAASFQERFKIASPLYVDPSLASYNAAGLKRTKAGTIGPLNWLPALKALFTGNFQGRTQGDPYQQGGVFIILPGDKLVYSYISKRPSDRPPVKKILQKLEAQKGEIQKLQAQQNK